MRSCAKISEAILTGMTSTIEQCWGALPKAHQDIEAAIDLFVDSVVSVALYSEPDDTVLSVEQNLQVIDHLLVVALDTIEQSFQNKLLAYRSAMEQLHNHARSYPEYVLSQLQEHNFLQAAEIISSDNGCFS